MTTDEFGQPAAGIIRIVDVTDPTDIAQAGTLAIPGTTMVGAVTIDGDRVLIGGVMVRGA